jgi:phosphatidylserine/phosphatidylglycerophosphate/cardiolipin synthase-like enzyme
MVVTGLVALAGCATEPPATAATGSTGTAGPSRSPSPAASPASAKPAVALSALIEPGAGIGPIYALLASARHTVDLVMYELDDAQAEQLLAGDAAHGVDVRVVLYSAYTGSENDAAFSYLKGHGVHVRWASSLYALTHQKTLVVDGLVAAIMTLNWTSRYYSDTRDVAVVDRIPADVAAIEATFDADYGGTRITPARGADLVWSPTTSEPALLSLINGAEHDLFVENEEMSSREITDALAAAARRGVDVEVCMTNSSSWSSEFATLVGAGVHLRVYAPDAPLYIHAKVLVRDPGAADQQAFVGSQNFSTESLLDNRELGIVLNGGSLVGQLETTIRDDYAGASPWTG